MRFSGKKAFVTGASRGIGREIAKALRLEGAYVVGTCRDASEEARDVCQEWVSSDFSYLHHIKSCAEFLRRYEPDILINNAGINKIAPFLDIALEDFQLIQQVNLTAPFLLCQAAIPAMSRQKWGRIVNISSIFGKVSKEYRASYSASKFAIDGMTLSLAAEHAANGILANCVAPGFIDTELTRQVLGEDGIRAVASNVPAKKLGIPEEIARLVVWLSSNENTYVTGQNIAADGCFSRV